jgi:hypothetical protein
MITWNMQRLGTMPRHHSADTDAEQQTHLKPVSSSKIVHAQMATSLGKGRGMVLDKGSHLH